jgi:hypothetical protein
MLAVALGTLDDAGNDAWRRRQAQRVKPPAAPPQPGCAAANSA